MTGDIILTKFAKLAGNIGTPGENNDLSFSHKNKEWILLDEFKSDAEYILSLISQDKVRKIKAFGFELSDDGQHLVILYRYYNSEMSYINRLLSIVYPNLKTSSSVAESKILNTYVTTKLFELLQTKHNENFEDLIKDMNNKLLLPEKFLPTLCEYQKKSILWLLKKEVKKEKFPAFFEKLLAKDNETVVYKHLYSNYIQKDPPDNIILPPGGILADEMGLGKTVEMLALILLNPSPEVSLSEKLQTLFATMTAKRKCVEKIIFCICNSNSKKKLIQCQKCSLWQHNDCVAIYDLDQYANQHDTPYTCPSCWQHIIQDCGLFKTKATFIVSPNTIKMQWVSEIKRHIQPTLRIFLYEGVSTGKWISPLQLAKYDIVLTDYTILRRDVHFTKDNASERNTRYKPRHMRLNTPILMMQWWRVLLDEAQMVESNTSKMAALVRSIPASNRWAVTGTPIQKSLSDLQPLLQFIGFEAASESSVWRQIVNDFVVQHTKNFEEGYTNGNSSALINILQKCLWRTCKDKVSSELNIPSQQEIIHRIQFNNEEKLFYNEQHLVCRSIFLENVQKYRQRMSTISPQIMNIILQPFLKIRQSCTIPVVVANSGANTNFTSQPQKQFLQPRDLHAYLKSTNELSCKTELRAMASSHNGLAALYLLQGKLDEALTNYDAVLKLAKSYSDMNIPVDSLLQIHALHNIMEIKVLRGDVSKEKLEPYETQYHQLEWKYLSTYASNLLTAKNGYESVIEKINCEITDNLLINVADGLESLLHNDKVSLLQKIQDECIFRFGNTNVKLYALQSERTLLFVLESWFNKLTQMLKTLQSDVQNLSYFYENIRSRSQVKPAIWKDIMNLVNSVYDCHLREIRDVQKSKTEAQKSKKIAQEKLVCKMCSIRNSISEFECLLFDKVIDKSTNYAEGLENPSFEIYLCKLIIHFIKNKHRMLNTTMEKNWLYLENLQLVCKRLIKFWIEIEYTIKAYDELNMCKMRITLTTLSSDKQIFKIRENEIEGRKIQQRNELMTAQNKFTVQLARLRYIKHLEGDDDPGPCPICCLSELDRYAVLECGHHICFSCLKTLRMYDKGNHFKCSICRNIQQNQKLYYVSREKTKTTDKIINGDYSSKITYIVRLILRLQRQQKEENQCNSDFTINSRGGVVKILIFSQWEPIIQSIALALRENDITFRAQCTPKTIEEFKNPKLGITCLLMPLMRGSKGLNLVEATHVFLVEPVLNPGEELQAIGRVHRFGQTRQTTVHRFIVSETIEENIHNFITSSSSNVESTTSIQYKWEFDNITLKDFENLFFLPETGECD